jgi:hypothetical protein
MQPNALLLRLNFVSQKVSVTTEELKKLLALEKGKAEKLDQKLA